MIITIKRKKFNNKGISETIRNLFHYKNAYSKKNSLGYNELFDSIKNLTNSETAVNDAIGALRKKEVNIKCKHKRYWIDETTPYKVRHRNSSQSSNSFSSMDVKLSAEEAIKMFTRTMNDINNRKETPDKRQSRLILCVNCNQWKVCSGNIEQGNCTYKDDGGGEEESSIPTNYDTRCLLGLIEYN